MNCAYEMTFTGPVTEKSDVVLVPYSKEYQEQYKKLYNGCYHGMREALGIKPFDFIQDDSFFAQGMENVYLSEMLPSVTGWNKPFIADEVLRGYCNEITDFMESVINDREPESSFELASQVIKVIYASYYSNEMGQKILID